MFKLICDSAGGLTAIIASIIGIYMLMAYVVRVQPFTRTRAKVTHKPYKAKPKKRK